MAEDNKVGRGRADGSKNPLKNAITSYTIRVPTELQEQLDGVRKANKLTGKNASVVAAIRFYVENQGDAIGSRKYFTQTMDARFNSLEAKILNSTNILSYYATLGLAVSMGGQAMTLQNLETLLKILSHVTKTPYEEVEEIRPNDLLTDALNQLESLFPGIRLTIIDMVQKSQQQQKQANKPQLNSGTKPKE
jgi:hypothetical protein